MSSLFQKISLFILAAACIILTVDKTKQSLQLNGVAARIAEKSAELEMERTESKAVREKLQNEIRERDERFRLLPKREAEKSGLPQPADPKDTALSRMAVSLRECLLTNSVDIEIPVADYEEDDHVDACAV